MRERERKKKRKRKKVRERERERERKREKERERRRGKILFLRKIFHDRDLVRQTLMTFGSLFQLNVLEIS